MEWTSSAGGPLICGERRVVSRWMGIHGLSANSRCENDYERTCATREFLEKIDCADGCVLVLGDEPHQSLFFRNDRQELAIARWVYADASNVEQILTRLAGLEPLCPPVPFEVEEGCLVLLDSAWGGFEIKSWQEVEVQPGLYQVTTEQLLSDRRYNFIVHRLVRNEA